MTNDAQTALRRTMEKYSKETRFCLICNYVSRIIDPLTSRCAKFRLQPLPREKVQVKLTSICKAEGIQCNQEVLDQLMDEIQTLLGLTNANVNLALLRGIKSVILAHMNGPAGGAAAAD